MDDETAVGFNFLANPTAQQIVTLGNAERPALAGNFTFSLFPFAKLTLTNQTSVDNIRMVGNSFFSQFTNGLPSSPFNQFTLPGDSNHRQFH